MLDEAIATQFMRHAWSRERAYFLMRVAVASVALNLLLGTALTYMATRPPEFRYFLANPDGTIRPLIALNQPVLSDAERGLWVTQAVTEALSFDFTNFRVQLERARQFFTPDGFNAFNEALVRADILSSVNRFKYVLNAVPKGAPVQLQAGNLPDGRFAWQYEIPVLLTFQASDRRNDMDILVRVMVVRTREVDNPRGLGIARFEAGGG
jgi:intracellular multiplication protein IcmL